MRSKVLSLWPEIQWIQDETLRNQVTDAWAYAIEASSLSASDLETIPFSLFIKDPSVSFMRHKRTTVQIAVETAKILKRSFGGAIDIDMDVLIAGAILIDIGKLMEYEIADGQLKTSRQGALLRHPFSGVAIAQRFELPAEVLHIIATHSKEGDLGQRSVESIIVHHADFVSFEPFKA